MYKYLKCQTETRHKTPETKKRRFKQRVKRKCEKEALLMPTASLLCGMKHGSERRQGEAGSERIEQSCSENTLVDANTHIDDLP